MGGKSLSTAGKTGRAGNFRVTACKFAKVGKPGPDGKFLVDSRGAEWDSKVADWDGKLADWGSKAAD